MIQALSERYGLNEPATHQLQTLLECVGTDPAAPTAVTERHAIVRDHLADSLVALELSEVRDATRLADLGSGAGFPGLPLAIGLPQSSISLVESNGRKCEFISRAARECGLGNVDVVNARAEAWPEGVDRFDLVTARALAPLAVVAEYAAPLLKLGGTALVWRGRREPAEEASARVAATELGLEWREPRHVRPYPTAADRHLQAFVKVAATPPRFPRRPGIARKRPLGGAGTQPSDR